MKINNKLKLIMIILTIVSSVFTMLFSFSLYFQYTDSLIKKNTEKAVQSVATMLDQKFKDLDILSEKIMFYSKDSYDLLSDLSKYSDNKFSPSNYYYTQNEIKNIFNTLSYRMNHLNFMSIILSNGKVISYSNSQQDFVYDFNPLETDWYQETLRRKGELSLFLIDNQNTIINSTDSHSLFFSKKLYNLFSKELVGTLLISISPDFFEFISLEFSDNILGYSIFSDSSNQLLFSNIRENNDLGQYTTIPFEANQQQFRLEIKTDFSIYSSLLKNLIKNTIIALLVFILISFVLVSYLSKKFTQPIVNLANLMQNQQNFAITEEKSTLQSKDEIGVLYNQYFNTVKTLANYANKQHEIEQVLLNTEVAVYKNQIDSHFLYNTLESINSLAEINDIPEISTIALSLSELFHYTANGYLNTAKIEDEIQMIKSYLSIQKIRFDSDYPFSINATDDKLFKVNIPKMILQPLVENSIYHGFKKNHYKGEILLLIDSDDKDVILTLTDNGVGMSEDSLNKLRNTLVNSKELVKINNNHIALINIEARLKTLYSEQYGLNIESQENLGTTVIVKIPLEMNTNV